MCRACVVEVMPDRERSVLESGSYVLNYSQCGQCASRAVPLLEQNRRVEVEDDGDGGEYTETVSYRHVCQPCGHEVAVHECVTPRNTKAPVHDTQSRTCQNPWLVRTSGWGDERVPCNRSRLCVPRALRHGTKQRNFFFLRGRYTFSVVADTQTYSMFCTLCGKGEYVQNMSVHVRAAHATPLAEVRVPLVLAHMPVHAPPIANHTHADNDDDDDDEWASN